VDEPRGDPDAPSATAVVTTEDAPVTIMEGGAGSTVVLWENVDGGPLTLS
jgi:hypothetical protein